MEVPNSPSKFPLDNMDFALIKTLVTLSITFDIPFKKEYVTFIPNFAKKEISV